MKALYFLPHSSGGPFAGFPAELSGTAVAYLYAVSLLCMYGKVRGIGQIRASGLGMGEYAMDSIFISSPTAALADSSRAEPAACKAPPLVGK